MQPAVYRFGGTERLNGLYTPSLVSLPAGTRTRVTSCSRHCVTPYRPLHHRPTTGLAYASVLCTRCRCTRYIERSSPQVVRRVPACGLRSALAGKRVGQGAGSSVL